MKNFLILLLLISSTAISQTAQNQIDDLEKIKINLKEKIIRLNDSISKIEKMISLQKSEGIKKMILDSSLTAIVKKEAKLKKDPNPLGEVINILEKDEKVTIVDYHNNYFGVCYDSICGYMSEFWINKDDDILDFISAKNAEEEEIKRIQIENYFFEKQKDIQKEEAELAELEKKYIKKYGKETYKKLKEGYYWLGMSKEMAIISLGNPNDTNRNVGSWGVHEQWIYKYSNSINLYLYFENGKLTSYQN